MGDDSRDQAAALAARFVRAIEEHDSDEIERLYAPGAVVWHCHDRREQTAEESVAVYRAGLPALGQVTIAVLNCWPINGGCIQQQELRAVSPGRHDILLPMMVRYACEGGRITRIDEYFDPAPLAVLAQ